ncbi:MAG: sigma-70 family RNA polymerase sigma factor [Verrucomicrobia bacterium]|nr:sigma-70 family RNA polymerase sigma factor [Verrucomicrobiota bacterium]
MSETIQCGHEWCRRLYEDRASELILYGRALGLSHSESEDVLQDTFLAMMRKSGPPEQPENYCVRSFRNRALNYRRNLWRRLLREIEAVQWFERSNNESTQERAAMRCLERLPQPQREVIVLKIWHGRTFESIGELLGVSPNTVAGRYRYGLEKLSSCLKERNYEELESLGKPLALVDAPTSFGER